MRRDVVLWIEDAPDSVKKQIKSCKEAGLKVTPVQTDHRFHDELEKNHNRICLIVVDVMLRAVLNLDAINIMGIDTRLGHRAGWMIVRRFLRAENQTSEFTDIPVLILSTRPCDGEEEGYLEDLRRLAEEKNHGWIRYLEKGGVDTHSGKPWNDAFMDIINDVASGVSDNGNS